MPADKLPHTKPCTLKMRAAGFCKVLAPMYQTIRGHFRKNPLCKNLEPRKDISVSPSWCFTCHGKKLEHMRIYIIYKIYIIYIINFLACMLHPEQFTGPTYIQFELQARNL